MALSRRPDKISAAEVWWKEGLAVSLEGMKLLHLLLPDPGSNCNDTVNPHLLLVFGFYSKDDAGTGAICSICSLNSPVTMVVSSTEVYFLRHLIVLKLPRCESTVKLHGKPTIVTGEFKVCRQLM